MASRARRRRVHDVYVYNTRAHVCSYRVHTHYYYYYS